MMTPSSPSSRSPRLLRWTLAVLLPAVALAQDATTPPPPPADDSDVVTLSPFEVRGMDEETYDATVSVTGTRVAAELIDLPFNVNVVTSQFLENFLADSLEEQFAYVSSFAPEEDSTNAYLLRGFRTNFQLRNGYARSGMFSKATLSRVEVIKGPAAAIYGRTQPGGVMNYITKSPRNQPRHTMRVAYGTDEYYRLGISSSAPILKKDNLRVRYRVDLDARHEAYDQAGWRQPYSRDRVVSGVVDFRFNQDRTVIKIEADRTEVDRLPVTRAPILFRDLTSSQIQSGMKAHIGLATDIDDLGYNNLPGTYVNRAIHSVNVNLEHQINSVWHFRIGGDYADRRLEAQEMYQFVRRYDVDTGVLHGRQPQLRMSNEIFTSLQADLLASFWLGRTEHRLLFTADYFQQHTIDANWRLTDASSADPNINESVLPVTQYRGIYTPIIPGALDPAGRPFIQTTDSTRQLTTRGLFASWRMASLGGKLITMAGVRAEESDFFRDNRGSGTYEDFTNSGVTPSIGATYRLRKDLTAFANYAESYYPSLQTGVDEDGEYVDGGLPNEEGRGVDIGLKSVMYDGKLAFTATWFWIERSNVAYTVQGTRPDGTNYTELAAAGLIDGQGFELDYVLKPFSGLRIFGAYSFIDLAVKEAGYDLDLVGRRWERVPEHRAALGFSYDPRSLRGLSFSGGIRYTGDTVFGNGTPVRLATDPARGARSGNDGRREILVPSFVNVDIGGSYTFRDRARRRHTLQFNVKNLLNDDTIRQSGIPADRRRLILTYRLEL